MEFRCVALLVGIALSLAACGEVEQTSSSGVDTELGSGGGQTVVERVASSTTAVTRGSMGGRKRLPFDSPSGSVRITNPCDTAIEVRYRLTPRGKGGIPPNVIATIEPGESETPASYGYAADTGARDVMVFAPKLGWRDRKRARQDGGVVKFTIDPAFCP